MREGAIRDAIQYVTGVAKNVARLASRQAGFFFAATGVATGFVVMIGVGYRITQTPDSPIGNRSLAVAIGVLVLVITAAASRVWRRRVSVRPRAAWTAEPGDAPHPIDARRRGDEEERMAGASRFADLPPGQFSTLHRRLMSLAQRMEAPAHLLPTYQHSAGNGLPHIEITGDTYHFVRAERGAEFERFSTTSVDELLYRIIRDVAWSMATDRARPLRREGDDVRREIFRQQCALLGCVNAEWSARCAAEHQDVLATFPFVDDRH